VRGATPSIQPELHRLMLERQRFLSHLARRLGVSRTEFDAVEELSQRGGVTPGELGERLSLTSGSVSALLDRLERLGWANRERHPQDRRMVMVDLTASGETIAEREIGPLDLAIRRSVARFRADERRVIERFLAAAADAAAELVVAEQALGDPP
jgi:DNA-binding MarR family transcriptional regulator